MSKMSVYCGAEIAPAHYNTLNNKRQVFSWDMNKINSRNAKEMKHYYLYFHNERDNTSVPSEFKFLSFTQLELAQWPRWLPMWSHLSPDQLWPLAQSIYLSVPLILVNTITQAHIEAISLNLAQMPKVGRLKQNGGLWPYFTLGWILNWRH